MRYALLINVDEALFGKMSKEEGEAVMSAYMAYGDRYKDKIAGGDALQRVETATTVRVRDGKTQTTDGPFAETKEQLGGFYIVNCDNLDEAVELASHIPDAVRGSIEVRPIMEFNQA
ncbi:MAG: YciI family protein [Chloroflexota bacterium]|nr:MAG: hypothetical protein DLM70_04975 [Chloroflexota bacterium]